MARPRWETATYGDAPHEYVLRHQCPTTFKGYQDRIREHGITEKFTLRRRTATYRYYYPGDGIVRAPMTSVLMIFEMTQDYAVIVPLMLANLVSLFIASRLQHEPIYEAAGRAGWHTPAEGGDARTTWSTSGSKSHANCEPVAACRDHGSGSAGTDSIE